MTIGLINDKIVSYEGRKAPLLPRKNDSRGRGLFYSYAFGQIPWLVHIATPHYGNMICQ